jgi:hypothetical protein
MFAHVLSIAGGGRVGAGVDPHQTTAIEPGNLLFICFQGVWKVNMLFLGLRFNETQYLIYRHFS